MFGGLEIVAYIPTKNIADRLGPREDLCPLCYEARAIWFGCCWEIRSELIDVDSVEDIVNLVINPPIQHFASVHDAVKVKTHSSIHIAVILETIWNCRNQVVHNNAHNNIHIAIILETIWNCRNQVVGHTYSSGRDLGEYICNHKVCVYVQGESYKHMHAL